VRASSLAVAAGKNTKGTPEAAAFSILDSVSMGYYSKWNIVYDQQHLRVFFRTAANKKIKQVDLARFEDGCQSKVMMLDINADLEGDVLSDFVPYTWKLNVELVKKSTAALDPPLPLGAAEALSAFPDQLRCTE
jgi:hypothetical protein